MFELTVIVTCNLTQIWLINLHHPQIPATSQFTHLGFYSIATLCKSSGPTIQLPCSVWSSGTMSVVKTGMATMFLPQRRSALRLAYQKVNLDILVVSLVYIRLEVKSHYNIIMSKKAICLLSSKTTSYSVWHAMHAHTSYIMCTGIMPVQCVHII